jgi:DNA-damage-inducible protein J
MDAITIRVRTDPELKEEADRLFSELGLSFSTAVNMFLRQAVRDQGLPFLPTLNVPKAETVAAMREADRIAANPNAHGCRNVDELFAELDS